jgi:hypothetical protein
MAFTFKPATGRGHVTAYRGARFAYVRKNVFGYWRTVTPARATHVVFARTGTVHPYTHGERLFSEWF